MKIKKIALISAIFSVFATLICSSNAAAYSPIEQKALGYGIYRCYTQATNGYGWVMVGETTVSGLKSYESIVLINDDNYVALPTGFSSLHKIDNNAVSCRELFGGYSAFLNIGGSFDGLLKRANIEKEPKNESEKKQLLTAMGYKADSAATSAEGECFKYKLLVGSRDQKLRNAIPTHYQYTNAVCSTTGKVNPNDIEVQGATNFALVIGKDNDTLTMSMFTARGNAIDPNTVKKYNLNSYSSFDALMNAMSADVSEHFSKQQTYMSSDTSGVSGKTAVIGDMKDFISRYNYGDSPEVTYSISDTHNSDDRAKAAYTASNNLLGSSFSQIKDLQFTPEEKFNLYKTYLDDFYEADIECNYGVGSSTTEQSLINGGYIPVPYYENGSITNCYAKATKNSDKKVYGLDDDNYFGAEKSFSDIVEGLEKASEDSDFDETKIDEGSSGSTANDDTDPCYNAGVEGMSWILCPAINNMASSVDWLDGIMRDWFSIDANVTFQDSTRSVWGTFRNIANALLIIVLLLIIFSQLTGVGIDNYGIKKMLPRLIVMGVLINLSYVICELAVDLSNILGVGLDNLFRSIGASAYQGYSGGEFVMNLIKDIFFAIGVAGSTAGLGITIASIASGGGIAVVISLVLVLLIALVAVLMFFLMLGARMVIVIIFTVIAPVAFACYILPNTQGLFKQWWKVFKAALIIFPIAGALYGASYIIRGIIYSGGEVQFWMALVAVFAPFLPFLLLPTLLRSAIAALGMVGGALSAMSNGLRKGLSGANSAVKSTEAYKEGQKEAARRMQGNRAQRIVNRLNKRAADNNGELSVRNQRRLARSHDILDRQRREDNAARTIMAEKEFEGLTESEIQVAWEDAFDGGNVTRLDALTNVLSSRYGTGAANWIAKTLARKNITGEGEAQKKMQASMRALQDNMAHNTTFANNMRNKASDAYQMISNGGLIHDEATGHNGYANLGYFSENNAISKDVKDWSTQSADTLQRAIASGTLTDDVIDRLLSSTDPGVQSGILSDSSKLDVLHAKKQGASDFGSLSKERIREYASEYRRRLGEEAARVESEARQAQENMRSAEQQYREDTARALQDINQELRRRNDGSGTFEGGAGI